MAIDFVNIALDFIGAYGLLAIFILLILDGALLLPVFPGELVLIMAVAAYATDPASLIFLIFLTTAAGIIGSLLLYGVTRGGGRRLVERFPGFFMMPRKRRERLERVFRNPFGQTLVLFLRLFPLTRVLVNIPAGLAKMPFIRFLIMTTIGLLAYHAGFLWFTYEARRPGSTIATQADQLQQAYASPAWAFVQANAIITGLAVVAVGVFLSVKATIQMHRDPEESTGSLLGWLATATLFWGGLALAAALYLDPELVYTLIRLGGLDLQVIVDTLGYTRIEVLGATALAAVLLGFILRRMRASARARKRRHRAVKRVIDRKRAQIAARQDEPFRPVPPPEPEEEIEFIEGAVDPWHDTHAPREEEGSDEDGPPHHGERHGS